MISIAGFFMFSIGIILLVIFAFFTGITSEKGSEALSFFTLITVTILVGGLWTITFQIKDNDECVLICDEIGLQAHRYADSKQCLCILPRKAKWTTDSSSTESNNE